MPLAQLLFRCPDWKSHSWTSQVGFENVQSGNARRQNLRRPPAQQSESKRLRTLLLAQSPEEECAEQEKEHVRKPNQQLWMHMRIGTQRVGDDDKQKIGDGDDQSHGKADRSFAPMRGPAQRHADQGKSHARKRKGKPFVDFGPAGAAFSRTGALQLIEKLFDRQSGTA